MPKQPLLRVVVPSGALLALARNALPAGMKTVAAHCNCNAAMTLLVPGQLPRDPADRSTIPQVTASVGGDGKLIVPLPRYEGGGL